MAKIKYLFFAVLALLLFSTPGSAEDWELTFEDHPYDIGSFDNVISGGTLVHSDDTNQLYLSSWNTLASFTVHHEFESDLYFSLYRWLKYYDVSCNPRIGITLYDSNSNVLGSNTVSIPASYNVYSRIHVAANSGSLSISYNGDVLGTTSYSETAPISYFAISGTGSSPYGDHYSYAHFDDFSTSPYCIGHKGYVKPADNIIYFTVNTPEIDGYSYYVQMCDPNGAEVQRWNVSSFRDTCNYTPAIDLTDDGLYYLYIYGQDDKFYYSKPFLYTSGEVPSDMIFKASGTVNADIRDASNQGGEIESGGERYLYMTEDEGGNYPINVTLLEEAFSFTFNHDLVYAMHDVNSSLVTFEELQNNYKVTLDGEEFPPGAAASGSFTFSGNLSDGDILNISTDCYEFDNEGNTTPGTIPVPLNTSNLTISTGNLLSEIQTNGTADVSANLSITEVDYYTAEITITNPSDQEGYQGLINISYLEGMQAGFGDIRFYAENGTKLDYWIEEQVNSSYAKTWVGLPANATKINLYYGNESAMSTSNGEAVFDFFDDFSGSSINGNKFNSVGSVSVSDGSATITGNTNWESNGIVSKTGVYMNSITEIDSKITAGGTGGDTFEGLGSSSLGISSGVQIYYKTGNTYIWGSSNSLYSSADSSIFSNVATTKIAWHDDNIYITKADGSETKNMAYSTEPRYIQIQSYPTGSIVDVYCIRLRKYEATEPTFSIGTPESVSTTTTATLSLTANSPGTAGNLISLTANATNISASGPYMTGGIDSIGYTNGATTWSYNITDWTSTTEHIFEFTPDLTLPGIYGYIKDPDTQQPLRTATVTIFNSTASYLLWTDSNGMYCKTTDLIPGQRYTVKAAKNRYVTFEGTTEVKEGVTTRYDLFLNREKGAGLYYASHDVMFTVWEYWNSGAGLPGASYAVYEGEDAIKTGITDSEGSFVVEDMTTGTRYKIIITHNEQIFTEFYEPGASSYTIILNKENIIHEYYNNWLNLTYEESAGCVNVSYLSNEAISQTSLIATASNGTTVYSETLTTDSGNFTFSYPEGDYIISFTAVTASGLTASQSWTVSYSTSAQLFPSSYPAWLKNLLYVAIILIFLLAFGKARNDIACGSAAVLTSIGYHFNWLVCSFGFVILIWIISLGAVFVHYKRTKGTG